MPGKLPQREQRTRKPCLTRPLHVRHIAIPLGMSVTRIRLPIDYLNFSFLGLVIQSFLTHWQTSTNSGKTWMIELHCRSMYMKLGRFYQSKSSLKAFWPELVEVWPCTVSILMHGIFISTTRILRKSTLKRFEDQCRECFLLWDCQWVSTCTEHLLAAQVLGWLKIHLWSCWKLLTVGRTTSKWLELSSTLQNWAKQQEQHPLFQVGEFKEHLLDGEHCKLELSHRGITFVGELMMGKFVKGTIRTDNEKSYRSGVFRMDKITIVKSRTYFYLFVKGDRIYGLFDSCKEISQLWCT